VDAISLTLPNNQQLAGSMMGGLGSSNSQSTANLEIIGQTSSANTKNNSLNNTISAKYEHQNVRDLAYDLGVEHKVLRK
jgi:hypothetical protein